MSRPRAIALLSGGLDSSIAATMAQDNNDVVLALTFDYGQLAAESELRQAGQIATQVLKAPQRTLPLPWFKEFQTGGALLGEKTIPHPLENQLNDLKTTHETAKAVWVPNRNGVMIEIAAGIAEDLNATQLIVGFNAEEAATFPDNSESYLKTITQALSYSTQNQVEVISPTAHLDKAAIVAQAKRRHFPFELLWSCYESRQKMCGQCESCRRLKRALAQNQIEFEAYFEDPSR